MSDPLASLERRGFVAAVALTLAAGAAVAHSTRAGQVQVGHAWALPSAAGATETQGFVPLLAQGGEDRLVQVATRRAERVEIRRTDDRGRTTPLATLRLQANQPIPMRPGRLHLAFVGIDRPFVAGERVPVRLAFEKGGAVDFEFWVESAPYASP
jgi:hypothetical protein